MPPKAPKFAGTVRKLPPLPRGSRISKRPLSKPTPSASHLSREIYVSSSAQLMSLVTRTRKILDASLRESSSSSLQSRVDALTEGRDRGQVVTLMGTGRAVEKALAVAAYFEQQGEYRVNVKTKTVGTVDDVVAKGDGEDGDGEDGSRVRRVSCLAVEVRLK